MERHFGQKLRFIFMIAGQDFHDNRSRFSWWQVEIFMMTCRDFHDNRSRFLWWRVEIFIMKGQEFNMNGRDFHVDRSRFLWWQAEIFFFNWDSLHPKLNSHYKAWSYKKKKHKKIKAYRKFLYKVSTVKRCLSILDLKPFRS